MDGSGDEGKKRLALLFQVAESNLRCSVKLSMSSAISFVIISTVSLSPVAYSQISDAEYERILRSEKYGSADAFDPPKGSKYPSVDEVMRDPNRYGTQNPDSYKYTREYQNRSPEKQREADEAIARHRRVLEGVKQNLDSQGHRSSNCSSGKVCAQQAESLPELSAGRDKGSKSSGPCVAGFFDPYNVGCKRK